MKVAQDVGTHVVNQMTEVKAAAMWVEVNISYQAACVILRYLHVKFQFCVQVPFTQISLLFIPSLTPSFDQLEFKKKGRESKVGKIVKYWTISSEEFIQTNFSRLLSCKKDNQNTTFQYKLSSGSYDISCLIGADHGTGKSRYLIQINYLP